MRFKTLCAALFGIALIGVVGFAPASAQDMTDLLDERGEPCAESDFTCVTITVPLDHSKTTSTATMDVVFAVSPASGERKGMFVTVVGGPGYSGLSAADSYSSYFDESLFESFDIVFFDQRGIGESSGLSCPSATIAYYSSTADTFTAEGEAATIETARTFAADCRAEIGAERQAILPYLGTRQAIQDLDVFREMVGDEQIWLYGESYGTQFAQTYATAYPERIAGLILDGVVDLSLEGDVYYIQQAEAFAGALTATLEACNADAACRADMNGDALTAYMTLIADLSASPAVVAYPLPDGRLEDRTLYASDVESIASGAVYDRGSRSDFLRALAAAANGDLVPMLRRAYGALGVDPVTLDPIIDESFTDASYYGIECNDYDFFAAAGDADARAEAWMRAGDAVEAAIPYLSGAFYGDLPCLFWGVQGEPTRPAPFMGGDYPTFILNSDIDPATPFQQGDAMFNQIANAYMITQLGAPHVIFGRDEVCPDVMITAFLVDDILPNAREYLCEGDTIDYYDPIPSETFSNVVDAIRALDIEISYLPEYASWDGYSRTTIGCTFGGTLTFVGTDEDEIYTLDKCELIAGLIVDGSGTFVYEVLIEYDVRVSGLFEGELIYTREIEVDAYTATGTIDGTPLTLKP
jgi:pimeloyl-ACP methyl ester carboxylesterase